MVEITGIKSWDDNGTTGTVNYYSFLKENYNKESELAMKLLDFKKSRGCKKFQNGTIINPHGESKFIIGIDIDETFAQQIDNQLVGVMEIAIRNQVVRFEMTTTNSEGVSLSKQEMIESFSKSMAELMIENINKITKNI